MIRVLVEEYSERRGWSVSSRGQSSMYSILWVRERDMIKSLDSHWEALHMVVIMTLTNLSGTCLKLCRQNDLGGYE